MEVTGTLRVKPGNSVAICLGDNAEASRQHALQIAQGMLSVNPRGFDKETMQVVKPLVPFKPDTNERWPDFGLHITVLLEGDWPWKAVDGTLDKVTEAMLKIKGMDGRKIKVVVDADDWRYLEGNPNNDEATDLVFYLAAKPDEATMQKHADLRRELGVGPMAAGGLPHLSLAGIKPSDGDVAAFRKSFCRPRPTTGFPDPYLELVSQAADVV